MPDAKPDPLSKPLRMERETPGVFVNLDAAACDVAIQTLNKSTAPVSEADELVAAVTGTAMKMVVAARVDLHLKGFTADANEMLPIHWHPLEATQRAFLAQNYLAVTGPRDLPESERELALTAAHCLLAIDRLRLARGVS